MLFEKIKNQFHDRYVAFRHDLGVFSYWQTQSTSYKKSTPPGRPSEECLRIYRYFIEQAPGKETALILGSTPDLRKLAAGYFRKVIVVDFSPAMLRETSKSLDKKTLESEKHVLAHWESIGDVCEKNSIDAALGDLIFKQLDPLNANRVLATLSSCLAKNGVFATRIRLRQEKWKSAGPR